VGPAGQAIHKLAPAAREQLKAHLRQQMPEGPGGHISYEAFASLNAKEDKTEQAAQLWGAAERLREEIGSPLPPNERDEYDQYVISLPLKLHFLKFLMA